MEKYFQKLLEKAFHNSQNALIEKDPEEKRKLFKLALQQYKKAKDINKDSPDVWQGLGRVYLHTKRFDKALETYKEGLQYAKGDTKALFYNGIGNVHRYQGEYNTETKKCYKKSITYYNRALKTASKDKLGLYHSNLSISYAKLHCWDEALHHAKKALQLLKQEEERGLHHGNQRKILELEISLYREYKKRALL